RVVRAPQDPPIIPLDTEHLLAWAVAFNHTLTRTALHAARGEGFELVHAHDWLVTHAAVTVKDHLGIPLVATIHATEAGRHQGWLPDEAHDRRPDCGGVPRGGRTAGARTAAPAGRGAGGQRVRAGRHNNLMSLSRRARLGRYGT